MATAVRDADFLERLQAHSPYLHALTRDTCSLTRMQGSNKINVVPPEAWGEIDCRILPDRPSEVFVDELRGKIRQTGVDIEVIMAFTPAVIPASQTSVTIPQEFLDTYVAQGTTVFKFEVGAIEETATRRSPRASAARGNVLTMTRSLRGLPA